MTTLLHLQELWFVKYTLYYTSDNFGFWNIHFSTPPTIAQYQMEGFYGLWLGLSKCCPVLTAHYSLSNIDSLDYLCYIQIVILICIYGYLLIFDRKNYFLHILFCKITFILSIAYWHICNKTINCRSSQMINLIWAICHVGVRDPNS